MISSSEHAGEKSMNTNNVILSCSEESCFSGYLRSFTSFRMTEEGRYSTACKDFTFYNDYLETQSKISPLEAPLAVMAGNSAC